MRPAFAPPAHTSPPCAFTVVNSKAAGVCASSHSDWPNALSSLPSATFHAAAVVSAEFKDRREAGLNAPPPAKPALSVFVGAEATALSPTFWESENFGVTSMALEVSALDRIAGAPKGERNTLRAPLITNLSSRSPKCSGGGGGVRIATDDLLLMAFAGMSEKLPIDPVLPLKRASDFAGGAAGS